MKHDVHTDNKNPLKQCQWKHSYDIVEASLTEKECLL